MIAVVVTCDRCGLQLTITHASHELPIDLNPSGFVVGSRNATYCSSRCADLGPWQENERVRIDTGVYAGAEGVITRVLPLISQAGPTVLHIAVDTLTAPISVDVTAVHTIPADVEAEESAA